MVLKSITTFFLIFFIGSIAAQCQTFDYEKEWKKVTELVQKQGRPASALTEVKKIYARARTDKNEAQKIRALVYMVSLQEETRENNIIASIKEIEIEIAQSQEPATSLLKSMQASLYWQYFQVNRWNLYSRSETIGFKKDDIATWSAEDLHKKISGLYLGSLQNKNLLQQVNPASFEPIIEKGNTRHLRPTLYDLLAHQALVYFKNDERDIRKPAYAFQIDSRNAFSPAKEFAEIIYKTSDSLSLHHKALLIYQELIRFHLNKQNTEALLDVDIERLEFVYRHSVHEEKELLYKSALEQIIRQYKSSPQTHQASYLLAMFHNQRSSQYRIPDTTYQFEKIIARKILEDVVKDSAVKTEGWTNSFNLLQQIMRPSFSFETEKVNLPGMPSRALVRYRNISLAHFRIIRTTAEIKTLMENGRNEEYWKKILQTNPVEQWQQELPDPGDLQDHRAEVKINALPLGEYILIASPGKEFKINERNIIGAQLFLVSGLSYANLNNAIFVLDRTTGEPQSKAKVDVYLNKYDYNTSRYTKTKTASFITDEKGFTSITQDAEQQGYFLHIIKGNDTLALREALFNYHYYYQERDQAEKEKIFFFTDRSIYRPGQKVQFKGIILKKTPTSNITLPSFATTIYLRDANYQLVDSLQLVSNEFGSVTGSFNLPQTGLTGTFYLTDKNNVNSTTFSVEEYKRPGFYVEYDKISQGYKLGDTITISGKANAYAGNAIGGAKVVYRVVRSPSFMYPWQGFRSWFPPTAPMEITNGITTTDREGKFQITFTAIPDKKIHPRYDPIFDYIVFADLTDIAGETRSGEKRISAGYKSLVIISTIPPTIHADSLKKISLRTENLAGVFQSSMVDLTITRLEPENRLIRKRYWEKPDQFVMTKEQYLALFPNDEYNNESDPANWPGKEIVYSRRDSSRATGSFTIDKKLAAGVYEFLFITKDQEGKEIRSTSVVQVHDHNNPVPRPEYLIFQPNAKPVEPGETAVSGIGSSAPIYLIRHIDRAKNNEKAIVNNNIDHYKLNGGLRTFQYAVNETDRGGFGVHYFFVKDNRFYQVTDVIQVPWSNKDLKVELESFRDKTLPGSEEKWTIKISGNKNEKLAAEMLASMYDASLDQFKDHSWTKPSVWPVYHLKQGWMATNNFSAVTSQQHWVPGVPARTYKKQYDRLILSLGGNDNPFVMNNQVYQRTEMVQSAAPSEDVSVKLSGKVSGIEVRDVTISEIKDDPNQPPGPGEERKQENNFQPRTNFNETAFFFPELRTGADGSISFTFTIPEALTKWKFLSLAHTKDLAFGMKVQEVITQKELMVQPNMPRFLRQGDKIEISTRIANLSGKEMTGQVQLILTDPVTGQSVDGWFINTFPYQYFTVGAGQTELASFPIQVPYKYNNALTWRIVASSGNYSDGEENMLPILSNKLLVTETLPLNMRGDGNKTFRFDKLIRSGQSSSLQHHALTVEYTSNPAWFAVQALPFLAESKNESSEQAWNRYYANALASHIANSSPRIRQVFEKWRTSDTAALLSNLQKNTELKNILLEETPWVLAAQTETEQKKNIALLFDMVRMADELRSSLEKLTTLQSANGGFVWFPGGPDDRYMTQYIVTGIGHLKILGVSTTELNSILNSALPYLDKKIKEDHDRLIKLKTDLTKKHLSHIQVQYLYMRSFFEQKIAQGSQAAYNYYYKQAGKFWVSENKYMQGMIALTLHRNGEKQVPEKIVRSLRETSISHEELGMYWKDIRYGFGWSWWHAPVETHSLLIEVFSEVAADQKTVDDLKTWLIKNKQTTHWRTSKATADACYAMLLQGNDWLSQEPVVNIKLGSTNITSNDKPTEAGTGYFKQNIPTADITPALGQIDLSVKGSAKGIAGSPASTPTWGAVYWQYFEDMDKITGAETPLKLNKKLFVQTNSDRGPVIRPYMEGNELSVGDKIIIRVELRSDRDMEYVHMKDLRATAFEPVNVISSYKWQGGLGYYESTKDAATHFFFPYLPKGTYVFEYALFVTHKGVFSNGITTIQSLYAPEFSSHSEGVVVRVN
jgi:hypothetical protein